MGIDNIIQEIKHQDWYGDQIEHLEIIPEREAEFATTNIDQRIQDYLNQQDIQLFSHQAKAISLIMNGEDVIITTPTASGKTLGFNIPVFDIMLNEPESRALYIYPTKALSRDQLEKIKEMEASLNLDLHPSVYDGDTPRSVRPKIRNRSRIIISNPYGLHQYLEWHHKWKEFFQHLDFVVIDEVHTFRGVFGSNVAMLIRRMKRIFENYNADPQFVLSSATIANPLDQARKLVGKEFSLVANDTSLRGRKHFLFWNPLKYPDLSVHNQTSKLVSYLVDRGLQTLCFTQSRRLAELIAEWSSGYGKDPVQAYRAGYRPEERRKLEKGLRNGDIRGVAATNALELGVDVGGLDAVILSGYPGTVTSTWQQAGRAGRGREDSLVILIGFENPLDQFFMKHPREFFDRDHEHAILDLDNPNITMGHLLCAATELPVSLREDLGKKYGDELGELIEQGLLHETPNGAIFTGTFRASAAVKLDNINEDTVKVIHNGELLETMDLSQAYREAHKGATLLHQGRTYLVEEFDLDQLVARVNWKEVDYYTQARSKSNLSVNQVSQEKQMDNLRTRFGKVSVSEIYTHYQVKKYDQVIDVRPLELPPLEFDTECSWLKVPPEVTSAAVDNGRDPEGGLHAIEHAMISLTPVYAMCDRWDIGGFSAYNPAGGGGTIHIYDGYEGGIGIAERIYGLIGKLLVNTYELIRDCDCEEGCPSCIYSPKCGNDNEGLDKEAALLILEQLV